MSITANEIDERTITVERMTGNGTKEITRDDFIKVWVDHASLWSLVDYDEITVMQIMVDEIKDGITAEPDMQHQGKKRWHYRTSWS